MSNIRKVRWEVNRTNATWGTEKGCKEINTWNIKERKAIDSFVLKMINIQDTCKRKTCWNNKKTWRVLKFNRTSLSRTTNELCWNRDICCVEQWEQCEVEGRKENGESEWGVLRKLSWEFVELLASIKIERKYIVRKKITTTTQSTRRNLCEGTSSSNVFRWGNRLLRCSIERDVIKHADKRSRAHWIHRDQTLVKETQCKN